MKSNTFERDFLTVALRQNAIFIPKNALISNENAAIQKPVVEKTMQATTAILCVNAVKLGFTFDEPLLHALNSVKGQSYKSTIMAHLRDVAGVDKNWTPLVKGWDIPTNENVFDHLITWIFQLKGIKSGTEMACKHVIPNHTFPLERYNGCPFCGTPFEFGSLKLKGQGSHLKVLTLWTEDDLTAFFHSLLASKTALDATQIDSLKMLLNALPLPEKLEIGMKETVIAAADALIAQGNGEKAATLFKTPTDILRFLWYKKTGFLQIIEPKTMVKRTMKNSHIMQYKFLDKKSSFAAAKAKLNLKYDRKMCLTAAVWLNEMVKTAKNDAAKLAEIMHPKRSMWVRFIRALRLAEYSKREGFQPLAELMDVFYNQKYTVLEGQVNYYRLRSDSEKTFALLQERPGLFARSLFANMLWFGDEETLDAFSKVSNSVPLRLLFTLNMYAENYFDANTNRAVKPLGGVTKHIKPNGLLEIYTETQLDEMKTRITDLCLETAKKQYADAIKKAENGAEKPAKSMFIEPVLYTMPIPIGNRSESIQDLPVALQGTRFDVEGDTVRVFLQWGVGLKAQHLDMDLSCYVAYKKGSTVCSYSNLSPTGCKHSGDIQYIPEKVGTAEYIDLDLPVLAKTGAEFVVFTCNAFTAGSLAPNLVVGWMNSKFPMKISEKTGVAYDPSCVQHQVRITQTLTKGLVFGVLDVKARQIIWLEMPFQGQIAQNFSYKAVKALLSNLTAKASIGTLLALKAEAQNRKLLTTAEAEADIYDYNWAINAAAVTEFLL